MLWVGWVRKDDWWFMLRVGWEEGWLMLGSCVGLVKWGQRTNAWFMLFVGWVRKNDWCLVHVWGWLSDTPVPQSFWLILHSSEAGFYFFWSPTEDCCVTVWWVWFVFVDYQVSVWSALSSVIGTLSPHQIMPDTSDTDLIVEKRGSDSSDCDTVVSRGWPGEIDLASDEWRMSQKLCGTGC